MIIFWRNSDEVHSITVINDLKNNFKKTYVSGAHDFGQSVQRFAILRMEHYRASVFEMGATKVAY